MQFAPVLVNIDRIMSYEPPTPSADLPTDVIDTLNNYSPELLRDVARYAEELAEYREREDRLAEADEEDEIGGQRRYSHCEGLLTSDYSLIRPSI